MKLSLTTLVAAIALGVAAAPSGSLSQRNAHPDCELDYDTAKKLVDGFGTLLTAFKKETALELLTADTFTDTSSSINFLAGQPLNGPTFPSRDAFIAGQGAQPPIGFEVLGIDSISCKDDSTGVIAFRWLAQVAANKTGGSKGINILYVKHTGEEEGLGWRIQTVYSEFNNAVWVEEFGGVVTLPQQPAKLFRA